MYKLMLGLLTSLLLTSTTYATNSSEIKTKQQLSTLLTDFLANKVGDDFKNHDRFWADDLIYTSSAGLRFNKSYIIDGIKAQESAQPNDDMKVSEDPSPTYSAEDIDIRLYGGTAIVAFKLVAQSIKDNENTMQSYYNTGTFVLRDNQWQAVAWQATIIPNDVKQ